MTMNRNSIAAPARLLAAGLLVSAGTAAVHAAVRLPAIFSDHMVLQAGQPVPVWGTAPAGQRVTVSVAGQTAAAVADAAGKWRATLAPLAAGGPLTLTVQGDTAVTVNDVLVGEVWLCSGQSNMALPVSKAGDFETERQAAVWPKIRAFQPNQKWVECSPGTVGAFSAAAYYFGRDIHRKTGQPVGLLNVSSGGTPIELWTSWDAQKNAADLKALFDPAGKGGTASADDAAQAEADRRQAVDVEGKKAVAAAKTKPGYLFDSRIVPLIPYAIRGAIWYQGEANSYTVHAPLYGRQLAVMITDWRKRWGYDFPFLSVQLPELGKPQTEPVEDSGRAWVRDGVLQSLRLPQTGMAVTLGTGEAGNNHPKNKQEVGRRLALWALATVYGQKDTEASGPLPAGHKISGNKIMITFTHTAGGLKARDGELKGFAIAGADLKWVWGKAEISGDTVVVSSPAVRAPAAVRYAWGGNPDGANLVNGAGLPASPFRTDTRP